MCERQYCKMKGSQEKCKAVNALQTLNCQNVNTIPSVDDTLHWQTENLSHLFTRQPLYNLYLTQTSLPPRVEGRRHSKRSSDANTLAGDQNSGETDFPEEGSQEKDSPENSFADCSRKQHAQNAVKLVIGDLKVPEQICHYPTQLTLAFEQLDHHSILSTPFSSRYRTSRMGSQSIITRCFLSTQSMKRMRTPKTITLQLRIKITRTHGFPTLTQNL